MHVPSVHHYPSQLYTLCDIQPPPVPGVWSLAQNTKGKTVSLHRGCIGGENTGRVEGYQQQEWAANAAVRPQLRAQAPVARPRRYPTAAVCSHARHGGRVAAMVGVVLCDSRPSARRGSGVGCLRNVWAVALNPWSPWRHLKRALGAPLKRPRAQGARPRWRARVKLGTGMHLKTPGSGCFPPRTKCQKGGWAGLAA